MNDDAQSFPLTAAGPRAVAWPLDTVRDCFAVLVAGPAPLAVDGHAFPGLPDRRVPLDELRDRLMAARCPQATRDAAWAHVVRRSRAAGGAWTVGCAGMALPALAAVAGRLSAHTPGDPADVHAEVLAGFVAALKTVDLRLPKVPVRLRWAAYRAGLAALTQALAAPRPDPDLFDARSGTARPASGHPDLVLVEAVAEGVLTPTEADLIAATRLGAVPVGTWADGRGTPRRAAYTLRRRAEQRLAAYLTDPAGGTPRGESATEHRPTRTSSPPEGRSQPVTGRGAGRPAPPVAPATTSPHRSPLTGVPACA